MIKLYMMDETAEGQSFDLSADRIYIGRSSKSDVRITDKSVSREHLKIIRRDEKYFVTDLGSTNGTFVNGEQISPLVEYEVEEGNPIVIGMSVICLGRACLEEIMPFLDSLSEEKDILMPDRPLTPTRNMELIGKVSDILKQSKDINEILEKILDSILSLLTRIDRGVIILFDDNTGHISNVITRTKERHDTTLRLYSRSIVNRVRQEGKAFIMRDTKSESDVDMSKSMKLMNVRSVMCVPLVSKSRVRGVIYVDSINKPHGFRNDDLSLLKALSSPAAMAIENATLYAREGRGLIQ